MRKVLPDDAALVPAEAKKVFDGVLFDVYQWQNPMFDGSEATFEMVRRPDTVLVIGIDGDKLLMITEDQPYAGMKFGFPGGRADDDKDESWQAAAVRELREETGYGFSDWRLVLAVQPEPKIERFIAVYLAYGTATKGMSNQDADGERIYGQLVDFAAAKTTVTKNPRLLYLRQLFEQADSAADLLKLPEFTGRPVER